MAKLRHVVMFRLYAEANPQEVIAKLQELGANNPAILEWSIKESLDTRKGPILLEDSLFASEADLAAFRASEKHTIAGKWLSERADWWTVDYIEELEAQK